MENLFKLETAKKDYLHSMHCTKVEADFQRYFIDLLLPTIIEERVKKLTLSDIPVLDSDSPISIECEINIHNKNNSDVLPYVLHSGNDAFDLYNMSNNRFEELKAMFLDFLRRNNISFREFISKDPLVLSMGIRTDVISLGQAIENEQNRFSGPKDPIKEEKRPIEFKDKRIDYLSTIYVDEVFANLYEKEFLDGIIVSLYKRALGKIDYRLMDSLEDGTATVTHDIFIGTTRRSDLNVPDEYLNPLIELIESFLETYHIGTVQRCAYENIITIRTTLNQLRDAYYMEKQRIEYYTSNAYSLPIDSKTLRTTSETKRRINIPDSFIGELIDYYSKKFNYDDDYLDQRIKIQVTNQIRFTDGETRLSINPKTGLITLLINGIEFEQIYGVLSWSGIISELESYFSRLGTIKLQPKGNHIGTLEITLKELTKKYNNIKQNVGYYGKN